MEQEMQLKMLDCDCEVCSSIRTEIFSVLLDKTRECLDKTHPGWREQYRTYQPPIKVSEVERLVIYHVSLHAQEDGRYDALMADLTGKTDEMRIGFLEMAGQQKMQVEAMEALGNMVDQIRGAKKDKPKGHGFKVGDEDDGGADA